MTTHFSGPIESTKGFQSPIALADGCVHLAPGGSDTDGDGSLMSPVATWTKAVTLVTASRKIIKPATGAYAEAAPVALPAVDGFAIQGPGADVCTVSATGTSVFTLPPGAVSSSFDAFIGGICVDHSAGAAQKGIVFSNAGMTKKLLAKIKNVTFDVDETTDISISVIHGDADNAIRIYVSGDGAQSEIGGAINFAVNNLADRLHFENAWLMGTITTPNVAKEATIVLYRCIVPHGAATAGGNATQVIESINSYSWIDYNDIVRPIFAAVDTADLAGNHTETIVA